MTATHRDVRKHCRGSGLRSLSLFTLLSPLGCVSFTGVGGGYVPTKQEGGIFGLYHAEGAYVENGASSAIGIGLWAGHPFASNGQPIGAILPVSVDEHRLPKLSTRVIGWRLGGEAGPQIDGRKLGVYAGGVGSLMIPLHTSDLDSTTVTQVSLALWVRPAYVWRNETALRGAVITAGASLEYWDALVRIFPRRPRPSAQ